MQTKSLSDTITEITFDSGSRVVLVGTAHVSVQSKEEVLSLFNTNTFDRVCIELDENRWESVNSSKEKKLQEIDVFKVIKEGKSFQLLSRLILSSYQKRIANNNLTEVGGEIIGAGKKAQEMNIPLSLCDRDITITLNRVWRLSKFSEHFKLFSYLLASVFVSDSDEVDIESLKTSTVLDEMLKEVASEFPIAKKVLIDERDQFLAEEIYKSDGINKLAVVGAGHKEGIIRNFEKFEKGYKGENLNFVPEKKRSVGKTIAEWSFPTVLITALLLVGVYKGMSQSLTYLIVWGGCNTLGALLFSIFSLSHPLSCLVVLLTSIISALSPSLGVGIFAGCAQALAVHPQSSDLENLMEDVSHPLKWFGNRVLHPFLILISTSIGSMLGTFVLTPIMMPILSPIVTSFLS